MTSDTTTHTASLGALTWDRGRVEVQALGGMLGPVEVTLADGRTIAPFATAPWVDEPPADWEKTAPPLLKGLRGDWLCLPFGSPGKPRVDLDPAWLDGLDPDLLPLDDAQHGACANAFWTREADAPEALAFSWAPDAAFPIARLDRRITATAGSAAIGIETRVTPRADCTLAWGGHPTFRLPEEPGSFAIDFGTNDVEILTFPGIFEAGVSRVMPAQVVSGLDAVPMLDGSTQSFAALPLPFDTEEILLVIGHGGSIRLTNHVERYRIHMAWDAAVFPSVLLWISNRGRTYAPWNGRFVGLGVEPVCSAFDLGHAHALNERSPLRKLGIPTATHFKAGEVLSTRYEIVFEAI